MKRFLAMLLALTMLLSCMPLSLAEEPAGLQLGEVIHGFEVVEMTKFPLINADVTYFVHQKTGAELLYLANEDTNRVFELTFKTPAESDMGVPHVFEHATLSGSEKYPSKELFFNLSYQTYNTYMNASTYSMMTTYPVASLSEEQLLKYADFYTDSCLNPSIMTDESIFNTEAWRYSMDSAESDLTISGTVYSEMQGSYTLSNAAYYNLVKTLFPGANVSHVSGGIPSEIPNMTWEDVKNFHRSYYHPSNSIAFLYGSFENYERFLELLDGYYAPFEKADIDVSDHHYAPITSAQTATFDYPVEAGSDPNSVIYYAYRIDAENAEEVNGVDLLSTLLGFSSFPLVEDLKAALPGANFSVGLILDTPTPAVVFSATGVDPEDAEVFKSTIEASIAKMRANGFDQEAVDSIIASFNMDIKLMPESSTLGVDMLPNIAYYWGITGDWHSYLDYIASIDRFGEWNQDGTFMALLDKHFINNANTALVVTRPAIGQKEVQDEALAASLAEKKAAMTEEEIAAIVESTKALEAGATGDAAQYVAQLQAVTVENLPEELRVYDYTDITGEDGVRRIDVAANVDGVGQVMVLLNVSELPQEYLHWFQLYTDLLCEVDTTSHTRAELASLVTRYLYDCVVKPSMPYEDQTAMHLRAAWKAADSDMQAAYDLIAEILFDSQFTDPKRILETVSSLKTAKKTSITNNIYQSQLYRVLRISDPTQNVYQYMTDIDYYQFLDQVEQAMAEDPQFALDALQAVQALVNNSTGAISGFAGSAESAANHRPIADAFLASLDKFDVVPAVYDIPTPARAEGIIVDANVQYNLLFATFEELGMEGYTGDLDAVTSLVNDQFLTPLLRDQYGAYTIMHGAIVDGGVYMLTYRDPNIVETYSVYGMIADLLASSTFDQETLDGYILSAYSYYAQSAGELAGASSAILSIISGTPQDEALAYMKSLKSIKAEDLTKYVDMYRKLTANGVYSTAGGAGAINSNASLFESIINPFSAVDPTDVAFEDCGEEHPQYEAVRAVFENGLMAPISDTAFGVDTTATVGDQVAACYVLLGGSLNPEEALAYLAQFGLVDAGATTATEMTRTDLVVGIASFLMAVGMNIEPAALPECADAADVPAELAPYFGWAVSNGLMSLDAEGNLAPNAPATRGDLAQMLMCFFE